MTKGKEDKGIWNWYFVKKNEIGAIIILLKPKKKLLKNKRKREKTKLPNCPPRHLTTNESNHIITYIIISRTFLFNLNFIFVNIFENLKEFQPTYYTAIFKWKGARFVFFLRLGLVYIFSFIRV